MFAQAVNKHKNERSPPELVKVYEKVLPDVWSLKGYFDLVDYKIVHDGKQNVIGVPATIAMLTMCAQYAGSRWLAVLLSDSASRK